MMAVPYSVLVTGANRGLGLEFIKQFSRSFPKPSFILGTTRSAETANCRELLAIAELDPNVTVLEAEVTDESSVNKMADKVGHIVGDRGLTLLINNAGTLNSKDCSQLEKVTSDSLLPSFAVNVFAPLLVAKALLPLLKLSAAAHKDRPLGWTRAAVVNITSRYGQTSGRRSPVPYSYGASKAALNCITSNLNADLGRQGIVAAAIDPGWVATDMGGRDAPLTPSQSVEGMIAVIGTKLNGDHDGYYTHSGQLRPW